MIDFYAYPSANSRRVAIALEEMELAYRVVPIDIDSGAQRSAEYAAISPTGKVPAIVDHGHPGGTVRVFESGAILLYLAADRARRFLPEDAARRADAIGWLFFQMSAIGPTWREGTHYVRSPQPNPSAIQRYVGELHRAFGTLDRVLGEREWLAGEYSVADMAAYTAVEVASRQQPALVAPYQQLGAWMARVGERPAVRRGLAAL